MSRAGGPCKKIVSEGVLGFLDTLIISFKRGTPRVTFFAETPAKWKVFSVICVAGSPILCAPSAPTISPGWACAVRNLFFTSPRIQSNACSESRNSLAIRAVQSVERSRTQKRRLELYCAVRDKWSSPFTTISCFTNFLTSSIT